MKKIFSLMLLCATILLTSCSDDDDSVAATGVNLDKTALSITVGETATLSATLVPDDASVKDVSWASGNTSVATVNEKGLITAISAGEAVITVTTADGGFKATCTVTVTPIVISVTGVTLNKAVLELMEEDKETLIATITPQDATNQTVVWSSSNPDVASVDAATGEVTAKAVGAATITVKTEDGEKTAACEVTVIEKIPAFSNEGKEGIDGLSWEGAYEIKTKDQLMLLAERITSSSNAAWQNKYYKLVADIDFGDNSVEWYPIGNENRRAKISFDGQAHEIKGHFVASAGTSLEYFGIFGYAQDTEIRNLHVSGSIDGTAAYSGCPVGGIIGGLSSNVTVINCTNKAKLTSNGPCGGIVGTTYKNDKIIACVNTGDLVSNEGSTGGILGSQQYKDNILIVGCINKAANLKCGSFCGGIAGIGSPTACWSIAASIDGKYKGGIMGSTISGAITTKNCYWKEIEGVDGVNYNGEDNENCASFTGNLPTADQIKAMNSEWAESQPTGREYQFNATTSEIEKIQ